MSRLRTAAVAAAAFAVAGLAAGTALAGTSVTTVPFTATYTGAATVQVVDDVGTITANGAGKATLVGASKVSGKGIANAAVQPCAPWGGTGQIVGAKGKLVFKMLTGASGCGDEEGQLFSLVGRATVVSGTGVFKGRKGSFKVTGSYNRGAGTFAVKFTGKLVK